MPASRRRVNFQCSPVNVPFLADAGLKVKFVGAHATRRARRHCRSRLITPVRRSVLPSSSAARIAGGRGFPSRDELSLLCPSSLVSIRHGATASRSLLCFSPFFRLFPARAGGRSFCSLPPPSEICSRRARRSPRLAVRTSTSCFSVAISGRPLLLVASRRMRSTPTRTMSLRESPTISCARSVVESASSSRHVQLPAHGLLASP